jgi:dTDP-4-dehydrorhamnose 3,5-epimerase
MRFEPTPLAGCYVVRLEPKRDARGAFTRLFCVNELEPVWDRPRVVQANLSCTALGGTVRGLHYQLPPHAEVKLVRCTSGAIFDVAVDVRAGSPTLGPYVATELRAGDGRMLLVPRGCAHGFQSLVDDVLVDYLVSDLYAPEFERGLRYDDPALGIRWPLPVTFASARDRALPDFTPERAVAEAYWTNLCFICGTPLVLRAWDRPGGLPGWGCPECRLGPVQTRMTR